MAATDSHDHSKACHDMLEGLSLYIDGDASEALCRDIERHIAGCENCRVVLDTLDKTVKLYREHGQASMPGEAKRRLYVALDLNDYLKPDA